MSSLAIDHNGRRFGMLHWQALRLRAWQGTPLSYCRFSASLVASSRSQGNGKASGSVARQRGPSTAEESLRDLQGPFDFVFIDANKNGYEAYYDAVLPMLADRGLIAVDNVLWSGEVLDPKEDDARAIADFNEKIAKDERVVQVITTIRDGVMLIRKS